MQRENSPERWKDQGIRSQGPGCNSAVSEADTGPECERSQKAAIFKKQIIFRSVSQ